MTGESVCVTSSDGLTDTTQPELCCAVVSCTDVSANSQMDSLTSSHGESPTATDSQSASFHNKLQESDFTVDSTHLPGICLQPLATSSSVCQSDAPKDTNTAVPESILANAAMPANVTMSSAQTVSVQEYCQAFEQWTWQYYWWLQHVHWMTWAAYNWAPPAMPCISSTGVTQSAVPVTRAQRQPVQQQQTLQQPRGTC